MKLSLYFSFILLSFLAIQRQAPIATAPDLKNYSSHENSQPENRNYIQYADLTASPRGLPLDDRLELDISNPLVFSDHYLDSVEQFNIIDRNLAYLNCGYLFDPTSAFFFDIDSYVNSREFKKTMAQKGYSPREIEAKSKATVQSCSGSVLISVAYYLGEGHYSEEYRDTCDTVSSFDDDAQIIPVDVENSVSGEKSYTAKKVTFSTPGQDFTILKIKEPRLKKTNGIPLCSSTDIICKNPPELTLAHLKYDRYTNRDTNKTIIPSKAITARCNVVSFFRIQPNNSEVLKHSCSALPGSSGGPILDLSCNKVCAVGVQNVGLNDDNKNSVKYNEALSLKSPYFHEKMSEFINKNCSL